MMPGDVHPPRLASWLVDLFTPVEQAETILGDLLEEFSGLLSESGIDLARRWYWRQSLKTIVHLIFNSFRVARWSVTGILIGAYLSGWGAYWCTEQAVGAILRMYHVYAHIDAYSFWLIYAVLVERLIEPLLMGSFAAAIAKGREVAVAVTLSLLIGTVSGAGLAVFTERFWSISKLLTFRTFQLAVPLLITTFVSPIMILIGGAIVRRIRWTRYRRIVAAQG
jgi:hypothetical protein